MLIYLVTAGGHGQWRQNKLDRLDWCWYLGLPMLSYGLTLGSGVAMCVRAPFGLEIVGASMILLLVIGIRNAWDLVLWMTQHRRP